MARPCRIAEHLHVLTLFGFTDTGTHVQFLRVRRDKENSVRFFARCDLSNAGHNAADRRYQPLFVSFCASLVAMYSLLL
jgi:hypothetical protein